MVSNFSIGLHCNSKKDYEAIELNAYKENKAGHRFYEREGFVHLGFHFVKRL